ncbi:hypothetical protein GCM10023210_40440 [Chryseobacterium ginsengisoli]|uniref:DUF2306 domain-containing protein n=2 Tax=Chryseobacterium ginsengisoli TaxID=363853 RepID=A0ABP9MVF6_9FLAO
MIMLNTISQYASFDKNVGFLKFKQEVVNNQIWLIFFYIHIFSIPFCLLTGITQFSDQFLTENRKLHRIIGKVYAYNILFINFPICFLLSIFSNGGLIGITGFLVQNFLWIYFTIAAIVFIKKRNVEKHKKYMILSYSITTTAVTFRIIKNNFYQTDMPYHLFYGIVVWISLFINLLIAYFIIRKKQKLSFKGESIS